MTMGATGILVFVFFANALTRVVSANNVETTANANAEQIQHLTNKLNELSEQLELVSFIPSRLDEAELHNAQVVVTLGGLVYAFWETSAYAKSTTDLLAQLHTQENNNALQTVFNNSVKHLESLTQKHKLLVKELFKLLDGNVELLDDFFPLVFDDAFLQGLKTDLGLDIKRLTEESNLLNEALEVHELLEETSGKHHSQNFPVYFADVEGLGLLKNLADGVDFLLVKNEGQKKLADKLVLSLHDAPTLEFFKKGLKAGEYGNPSLLVGWERASPFSDEQEHGDDEHFDEVAVVHKLVNDGLANSKNNIVTLLKDYGDEQDEDHGGI